MRALCIHSSQICLTCAFQPVIASNEVSITSHSPWRWFRCCSDIHKWNRSNGNESNATVTGNASLFATTINVSVEDLWDEFIGPVEVAKINTTVAATPVPTNQLIPPPPLYYSPFLPGVQNPKVSRNSSWKFPESFWWGVASAAYQVEGAAKAEGRGPSIWNKLTRIPGNTVANRTGDIADNQYYLHKQDIARIAALRVP